MAFKPSTMQKTVYDMSCVCRKWKLHRQMSNHKSVFLAFVCVLDHVDSFLFQRQTSRQMCCVVISWNMYQTTGLALLSWSFMDYIFLSRNMLLPTGVVLLPWILWTVPSFAGNTPGNRFASVTIKLHWLLQMNCMTLLPLFFVEKLFSRAAWLCAGFRCRWRRARGTT